MIPISDEEFDDLISQALASLPGEHVRNIQNVAIVMADDPTPEQRQKLQLRHDQTLFGLYEGVPLTRRQGHTTQLPDVITLFKGPITRSAADMDSLKEQIRHTLWHEIGHYYGLDHGRIHELEQ
jgi:predicted Zn-dependent protease with MMP-like domain